MMTPSQETPVSATRASTPATISTRPQREAATRARKRLEDAYSLYPFEQEPDADSNASPARPSAPWPTPVHSDDSSDGDDLVDDSDSDRPRRSKAALEKKKKKKKKRRASAMRKAGETQRLRIGEILGVDDGEPKEGATGFIAESGNGVGKENLQGKASWAPREEIHGGYEGHEVRRAGLSDMGPVIGSNMARGRDVVWTGAPRGSANRRCGAKGPVDGDGYRVSRFFEHL